MPDWKSGNRPGGSGSDEPLALHSQELVDPLRGYLAKLLAMCTPGDLKYAFFVTAAPRPMKWRSNWRLESGKHYFTSTENGFHGKSLGAVSKGLFKRGIVNGGNYHFGKLLSHATYLKKSMASMALFGGRANVKRSLPDWTVNYFLKFFC